MKKLLVVGVIVLFLGLAIAPSINAEPEYEPKEESDGVIVSAMYLHLSVFNDSVFVIHCRGYNQSSGEIEVIMFKWMTFSEMFDRMGGIGSFYRHFQFLLGIVSVLVGVV